MTAKHPQMDTDERGFDLRFCFIATITQGDRCAEHVVMQPGHCRGGRSLETTTLCGRRLLHGPNSTVRQRASAHDFTIADPSDGVCAKCQERLEAIEQAFHYGQEGYR